ncbi:hypothetical protein ACFP2T_27680 [Plantactinospora solaniradicis]|uniref:Uncharacterized protein n=1 Tax=Plantactinospora solaniradicis TaxID=1723736 RepID=A0ABW1KE94_9ACTN
MTESDSRVARWSIRDPWWATGLWLALVATTVVLDRMVQNKQAEFSEPDVLEPVTVMASAQRRN